MDGIGDADEGGVSTLELGRFLLASGFARQFQTTVRNRVRLRSCSPSGIHARLTPTGASLALTTIGISA